MNQDCLFVSNTYLKGLVKLDRDEIFKRIVSLSLSEKIEECKVNYLLTLKILKSPFNELINESILDELIFEAGSWASKEDYKQKVRPKSIKDIVLKKNISYFSLLIQSISEFLLIKHKMSYSDIAINNKKAIKYNIEYSKYLNFLYELTCIKRKR